MVEFGLRKSSATASKPAGIKYLTLPRRSKIETTLVRRSPSPVKAVAKVEPIDIQVEAKENMIGKELLELMNNLNLHSKEMKELSSTAIKQQKAQEDRIKLEEEKQTELFKKSQAEAKVELEKKAELEKQKQEPIPVISIDTQEPEAQKENAVCNSYLINVECPDAALDQASKYMEITTAIKKTIKPKLFQMKPIQDQLMRTKMKINKAMGQLTNSQTQIISIAKQSAEIFTQSRSNEEFYKVVLYLTAKKICKQAQMECAVRKECSFPLAIVCVYLSSKHPDFLPILLGRMFTVCCFLIPSYPLKQKEESSVDFMVRCGYKIVSKDDQGASVLENEVQFGERMGGLIALYSAIVQTDISKINPNEVKNPHGIDNGWMFISRLLNMKPRKVTPLFVLLFFEIAGFKFLKAYGDQGLKIITYLKEEFIPKIPTKAIASTTKLKLFLEETVYKTRAFPEHSGRKLLN